MSGRLQHAERLAREAAQAERQETADRAMLETGTTLSSVAVVLANRKTAVAIAMDLAYGITQADSARWAAEAAEAPERDYAAEWKAEQAACRQCKYGRPCSKHGTAKSRTYECVGSAWRDGFHDAEQADLG